MTDHKNYSAKVLDGRFGVPGGDGGRGAGGAERGRACTAGVPSGYWNPCGEIFRGWCQVVPEEVGTCAGDLGW